ncbi:MAG: glucose-1-phosphate thymidylyltransferase RfbA [bacterium]|nr:glucose-1-phosphate thymidylyltransferase RfbA [bacterium]
MKGIVLAGGSGTRLYPITEGISKQLMPIYDKPMIYYPLSTLMLAGIKDILVITTKDDQSNFIKLLGDGSKYGINLSYAVQDKPLGIAQAFLIGENFINNDECALALGDNLFFGNGFVDALKQARDNALKGYATNFAIEVPNPKQFGVVEIDKSGKVLSIEEKPENPKSNLAVTGLYFYPKSVVEKAKLVVPSKRGELEITSINNMYLKDKRLCAKKLGGGFLWYDTGTFENQLDAILAIRNYQNNKGKIIACLEQIAYDNGWIDDDMLLKRAKVLSKNTYGKYLLEVLKK